MPGESQDTYGIAPSLPPSLELVKICEVAGAPGLVRAGADEWGELVVGGVEAAGSRAKTGSLTEPFVRAVRAFSSHSAVHCKTH